MENYKHILFQCNFEVEYHGILKNSKQMKMNWKTKKMYIGSSDRSFVMKNKLVNELYVQKMLSKSFFPIDIYFNAQLVFYFPASVFYTKKGVVSSKVADLSNLYSIVEDALQKSGVIENDRLIRSHDGSDRLPSDDGKYHLSILLTRAKQYETIEVVPNNKKRVAV